MFIDYIMRILSIDVGMKHLAYCVCSGIDKHRNILQ